MNLFEKKIKTKVGELYLIANDDKLLGILWESRLKTDKKSPKNSVLEKTEIQLKEYLDGKRKKFDIPLELEGTEFQKRVWKELQKIPFGKTISYKELAQRVGSPKACRAVGSANGKNPISIIVPCHRVIASDGSLGGYAGGCDLKVKLLEVEQ